MTAPGDGGGGERAVGRRSLLGALGTALAGGVAVPADGGAARTPDEEGADGREPEGYAVVQGDRCSHVVPLAGDEPVEALYDYRSPGRDGGVGGSGGDEATDAGEGSGSRSHGTTDLQRRDVTVTFLYDGPRGLSLVVLHDCAAGSDSTGGAVSWTVEGVPADAEWAVRDDPDADSGSGDPAAADNDCWDVEGDVHSVNWSWAAGDTDGGALRTAGGSLELTVRPAFNEVAARWDGRDDPEPIREWAFLSFPAGRESPERTPLALEEPVVVRRGSCEASDRGGDREDMVEVGLQLAASSLLVEPRAAVPVELLPDEPLDPDDVVAESLRLGAPAVVDAGGGARPVGGVGDDDLVYDFPLDDLGDTEFKLVGRTTDGRRIVGTAGFSPPDFDPFGSGDGADD
jgi:hypothetical protein